MKETNDILHPCSWNYDLKIEKEELVTAIYYITKICNVNSFSDILWVNTRLKIRHKDYFCIPFKFSIYSLMILDFTVGL
jgi:hypothetical protein